MNRKFIIFTTIGLTFVSISILLFIKNKYEDRVASIKSKNIYLKIEEKLNKIDNENINIVEDFTKKINVDGYSYIGTINIPVLGLELPIMDSWDYEKMKLSPCRYYGSIYTNDLVICAHAYESMFANVKRLEPGDKVILSDVNNKQYIYEVELIETLSPYDVKEMIESDFDLTIFTCTYDNLNRITVRLNKLI